MSLLRTPALLLCLAACSDPPPPAAADLRFDPAASGGEARTVQQAIDDLYRRQKLLEVPPKEPLGGGSGDEAGGVGLTVQTLQLRISELEQTTTTADRVGYDPRQTTLSGRSVQEALTELEARVARLEKAQQSGGAPGPGLFELRDKNGNLVKQGQPDGQGGQKGPPGGQPGGQKGQPGGQPGGQQGGQPNGQAPPR